MGRGRKGDVVTNDHVAGSATSFSVHLYNGNDSTGRTRAKADWNMTGTP